MILPKSHYKVIACDIDGCLFDEIDQRMDLALASKVNDYNTAAMKTLDKPLLTLCTGRPQPFAECVSRIVGNLTLPVISENGVWLHYPENMRAEIDPRITREHKRAIYDLQTHLFEWLIPQGAIIQPGKSASISIIKLDDAWLDEHVIKIQQYCDEKKLPIHVSRTWSCINCNLNMVNKSTGMLRLFKKLGVTRRDVIGIGDTMADLGIVENVDLFCCPSNADERLKKHAHYISPKPVAEGVLDILNWISQK